MGDSIRACAERAEETHEARVVNHFERVCGAVRALADIAAEALEAGSAISIVDEIRTSDGRAIKVEVSEIQAVTGKIGVVEFRLLP